MKLMGVNSEKYTENMMIANSFYAILLVKMAGLGSPDPAYSPAIFDYDYGANKRSSPIAAALFIQLAAVV